LFRGRIEQLVALTARYAMPTIYNREFAAAGGLLEPIQELVESDESVVIFW
jgi:hypothetical protein